jgi:hypothetical protein
MTTDPKQPKPGSLLIDATPLEGVLIDLPAGGTKGLSREKDGCQQMIDEINANHPTLGGRAGITDDDLRELNELHQKIAQIDYFLPAAEKLTELLHESRIYYEDKRERQIRLFVSSIESRSKQSHANELQARYQKTREYYSQIGKKAAQARQRRKAPTEPQP